MGESVENIVLVVVDALRPDRVGAYSGANLTPNMDLLAQSGEVFTQCYSCINATDPSVTTILTGLYPTRHGLLNHGVEISEEEQKYVSGTTPLPALLPETHRSAGIDTLERWHKRGFDDYLNPRYSGGSGVLERLDRITKLSAIRDKAKSLFGFEETDRPVESETISNLAIEFFQNSDKPFFLFAHYWESHIPYISLDEQPEAIRNRTYDGDDVSLDNLLDSIEGSPWKERLDTQLTGNATTVADMKRKYDAGVWKVDQAIGDLINSLKEQEIFEETAVIVTADHGESLTEHGIFFDHHGLYDPSIHVPLIINAPGFNGRETKFVQHFDLVPTVLDFLDIDFNTNRFDGVSLLPDDGSRSIQRDAVFLEECHTTRKRAIRTKTHKFIRRLDDREECRYCGVEHGSDEELYEIQSDPEEKHNMIDQNPRVGDELQQKLESWIQGLPAPSRDEGSYKPSNEVKDHLEEMGYL